MRALLIGSSGQLSSALREAFGARGASFLASSSSGRPGTLPLDLADATSVREFFRVADDRLPGGKEVFLSGAFTHVDRCETDRDLCRRINAEGPRLVAEECRARGHKLTFFSTEYVFGQAEYEGGRGGPFSEEDAPAPTSYYGACKLEAEREIQKVLGADDALILRTTMVFSWALSGNNVLMQYFKHLSAIAEGSRPEPFRIPVDQISTPTYAPMLAEAACWLREQGVGGTLNLVGRDLLSRRELVERVIAHFGFDREKSLAGFRFLKTAELGQKARRPLTAGLKMDKAARLGIRAQSLGEALKDVDRLRARKPPGA